MLLWDSIMVSARSTVVFYLSNRNIHVFSYVMTALVVEVGAKGPGSRTVKGVSIKPNSVLYLWG